LYDFRERIKVDGGVVTETFVTDFVQKMRPVIETIKPSFFEITVAMAFQYFAEQQIDIAVIEVGLGGRLDSTNIITPELSIITNISWDHMNLLGNTLPEIAGEKAGIIKENIPVVIGERDEVTAPVFEKTAAMKNAPLYFADDYFSITNLHLEWDTLQAAVQDKQHGVLKKFVLDLPGIYQTKNLATVLKAVAVLNDNGFVLTDDVVQQALRNTKKLTGLLGRWDVVRRHPTVVLDVAHNEAGIRQLLEHLKHLHYKCLHFIVGFVKDKEIDNVLQLLPKNAAFYFTHAHIPRALDAVLLQQKAAAFQLNGNAYSNVNDALRQAANMAAKEDLIIVCGSIFLVAEVDAGKLDV
jgi:dihydrofolate synthase/folylpolyglutamate synthase